MSSVDVIVPSYNYGHYLQQCISSAVNQDGVDVRVLIIDDCSLDNTLQVAHELVAQDNRIEYRRHSCNQGHIATYNEGIDWAQRDYLVLLSADDVLAQGALARAAALLDTHPEVGLCFGETLSFLDTDPVPAWRTTGVGREPTILTSLEFIERACTGDIPLPVSVMVRTSIQKVVGGWRRELPHAGDPEMWLRFAAHGPIGMLPTLQGYYRRHRQNMSIHYRRTVDTDWQENAEAFNIFFKTYGHQIPEVHRLRELRARKTAEVSIVKGTFAFAEGDVERAKAWLDAARSLYPPISSCREYSRLALKLRLGFWTWYMLSPVPKILHWLRR